jgi:hypothetical protein
LDVRRNQFSPKHSKWNEEYDVKIVSEKRHMPTNKSTELFSSKVKYMHINRANLPQHY